MSLQRNYVEMCNWVDDALKEAEARLERLTAHEVLELQGLIDEEVQADGGRSLNLAVLKQVVDADAAYRRPSQCTE